MNTCKLGEIQYYYDENKSIGNKFNQIIPKLLQIKQLAEYGVLILEYFLFKNFFLILITWFIFYMINRSLKR